MYWQTVYLILFRYHFTHTIPQNVTLLHKDLNRHPDPGHMTNYFILFCQCSDSSLKAK